MAERELRKRFARLKLAIIDLVYKDDAFGLTGKMFKANVFCATLEQVEDAVTANILANAWQQWANQEERGRLKAFKDWLRATMDRLILAGMDQGDDSIWLRYAEDGWRRGAERAFDDTRGLHPNDPARMEFLRSSFSRPVNVQRIHVLAARSFSDLQGITEAMSTAMVRTLADGLVTGKSPRVIARDLVKNVDGIGVPRALTLARTEIVRAHAEGQLETMRDLGVMEVGVMAEWAIVTDKQGKPDSKVCPLCRPLDGIVMTIDEAKGMLPRHPNCRCAWLPANVGEGKPPPRSTLLKAIKASQDADSKKSTWKPAKEVAETRPVANMFNRCLCALSNAVYNVFCATGKGGGVDPSCSPGGKSAGFPSPSEVKVLKSLPGSTGPKLVQDKSGKKWVMKSGSAERLQNEVAADNAYRALGVATPRSGLVDGVKFAEYIEGGETLAKWRKGKSQGQIEEMHAKIGKDFVADAVLANWDSVGTGADNILIKDGTPYRIDNGGALKFRAMGSPKGNLFGSTVGELQTLRDPGRNYDAAEVFGKLSKAEINTQIAEVLPKRSKVLDAVDDPATKAVLSKRFDFLASQITANVFCATGKGGGVDPTCSPGGSRIKAPDEYKSRAEVYDAVSSKLATSHPQLSKYFAEQAESARKLKKEYGVEGEVTEVVLRNDLARDPDAVKAVADVLHDDYSLLGAAGSLDTSKIGGDDPRDVKLTEHMSKVKLTQAEADAIDFYTDEGFRSLNKQMRSSTTSDFEKVKGDNRKMMEAIESVISKTPKFDEPVDVVRAIEAKGAKGKELVAGFEAAMKAGTDVQLPSFSSFALGKGVGIVGNIKLKVKAKSGYYVGGGEKELIQSPKTKYKVADIKRVGKTHFISMEEI